MNGEKREALLGELINLANEGRFFVSMETDNEFFRGLEPAIPRVCIGVLLKGNSTRPTVTAGPMISDRGLPNNGSVVYRTLNDDEKIEICTILGSFAQKVGVHFKLIKEMTRWGLWAFLAAMNALTFHDMTNKLVTLQFFAGSVGCLFVFVFALFMGKFSWPTTKEWRLFGIVLAGIIVWYVFRSATAANMIIFAALAISFIPTYQGVWRDPRKETPLSWILWTCAFLITAINVVVNWKGQPLSLVMPIGGAMLHGAVALLSTNNRKERFRLARA